MNIPIFLSRPNPFVENHLYFLQMLKQELKRREIKPITLQANNYDISDSLNYLMGMIQRCYGLIIVGFKQIYIESGCKKRNGINDPKKYYYGAERELKNTALTSPYCQIEGTIGLINRLPILIINEQGLFEEGIVVGGRFSSKTKQFDLTDIDAFFVDPLVCHKIDEWADQVHKLYNFLNIKMTEAECRTV